MKKGKFLLAFIIGLMLSINVNAQSIFVSGDNLNDDKFNLVSEKLINAFNILLPRKCSFEK